MKRYLVLALVLLASCGTVADEPVTATESAAIWTGEDTFINGHIFCGNLGWYPKQTVYQTAHAPYPFTFSTRFYAWGASPGVVNYNLMVLVCPATATLYSGGDGGWYSHAALTSCSIYTKRAGVNDWSYDSDVSVRAYNAVYYPNDGANGTWGLIIDWYGGGSGTHDLWNSCGFADGVGGSLWYTFYSPI